MDIMTLLMAKKLSGSGGGGVSSWNDLTDKPFYEETTPGINIEWDGNTEGCTDVQDMFFKVTDQVPTNEQLMNSTIVVCSNGEERTIQIPYEAWQEILAAHPSPDDWVAVADSGIIIVRKPNSDFMGQFVIEKPGTYLQKAPDGSFYVSKLICHGSTVIHKLDEKYLPETAATKEYVEEVILGGAW